MSWFDGSSHGDFACCRSLGTDVEQYAMSYRQEMAELIAALHRDVRWLQNELKRIRDAKALDGDKLRQVAAESLEKSKLRFKRTASAPARGSSGSARGATRQHSES